MYIHNSQLITVSIIEHNKGNFWEIPKSILGKFSSIIDSGLTVTPHIPGRSRIATDSPAISL